MDIKQILSDHAKWLKDKSTGANADLSEANLYGANLYGVDLRWANFAWADISKANLCRADLSKADISKADLIEADLSGADLSGANLIEANISGANLSGTNLSGVRGLKTASEFIAENFESTPDGVIVYKMFGLHHSPPNSWGITSGATIEEIVNPCRTVDCACGINVATLSWIQKQSRHRWDGNIWKCLIRWEWLPDVVVPYNSDGKIRAGKVQLLEIVN